MSTFLRALGDAIPRLLRRLARNTGSYSEPIGVVGGPPTRRWRVIVVHGPFFGGELENDESHSLELYVYRATKEDAQRTVEMATFRYPVKPIPGWRGRQILTPFEDGWSIAKIELDTEEWKTKLEADFYRPETRAG